MNTLIRASVLVILSILVFGFWLLPVRISGPSMLPTYPERRINFVNRLAYVFHEPRRGDIVGISFSDKTVTSVMLCKRIIGLPGETIEFEKGHVLINGKLLNEPYVKYPSNWQEKPVRLNPDNYYVVGDNRSMDSNYHVHGEAERAKIVGKMIL